VILSFGRDATTGELTSLVAPWGTTAMGYNDRRLLSSVTEPAGGVFSLSYDPMGRLTDLTLLAARDDSAAVGNAGTQRRIRRLSLRVPRGVPQRSLCRA
jgi:YD repeat-containing protein